ncbi:MAG TPA: hypothetical protein PLF00_02385 [Candidatus Marinimicrobia bacterium]|nr:hypothetical protein [Candidatus Neomarinimicrobiota bacterium]
MVIKDSGWEIFSRLLSGIIPSWLFRKYHQRKNPSQTCIVNNTIAKNPTDDYAILLMIWQIKFNIQLATTTSTPARNT